MGTVVLMYHAVTNGETSSIYDAHYSVSQETFRQQIKFIQKQNLLIETIPFLLSKDKIKRNECVGVTFDDGAITDYDVAFPVLCENNAKADFFVNSSNVNSTGFLDWRKIREMQNEGMSFQSHGHTHRYFDELSDAEVREELELSKKIIEDKTGVEVTVFAPPGGRLKPSVWRIAEELGYKIVCHSKPGVWSNDFKGVPRFAVLNNTSNEKFRNWVSQNKKELFVSVALYNLKYGAKRILGNSQYEKLRSVMLQKGE